MASPEKYPETLLELLDKYDVTIPIIQRDYVQGSNDAIIDELLGDIKNAIENTSQLSLNFVYGKTVDSEKSTDLLFIPLDGQQRLTTLFLLYVYSLRNTGEKDEALAKFTYETRRSSRVFFTCLCEFSKRKEVLNGAVCPSVSIQDAVWFHSKWRLDPTVRSSLRCLDKIADLFSCFPELSEKLESKTNKPVVFNFVPMTDMGMEDSLYIKLNARGRSLTDFETFKADLITKVEKDDSLSFSSHDFAMKLDTTWSDFFWDLHSESFDTIYRRYFALVFGRLSNEDSDTFIEDYSTFSLSKAYYTLEYVVGHTNFVTEYIKSCVINPQPSYPQRLIFNALSLFFAKSGCRLDEEQLFEWFRVINNLTVNSTIERVQTYVAANNSIDELGKHHSGIIEFLASTSISSLGGFSPEQLREECVKSKLILRGHRKAIVNAEQHKYFQGQLRSALYMADLKLEKMDSYNDEQLNTNIAKFSDTWEKISALFNDSGPEEGVGTILRVALLTYGEYMPQSGQYLSLCVDRADEPTSLKALFASGHKSTISLINDLSDAALVTIKQELQNRINAFIATCQPTDWKLWIAKYPEEMMGYLSSSYMRICKVNDLYLLVSKYASSSFCRELFTYALHLELKKVRIDARIPDEYGRDADYRVVLGKYTIRYISSMFEITDEFGNTQHKPDIPTAILMLCQE